VNFVGMTSSCGGRRIRREHCALHLLLIFLGSFVAGCGDNVCPPTLEQLADFEQAGPSQPSVDMDLLRRAQLQPGPYRVVPDDVLEFTMPALLQAVTAAEAQAAQAQTRDDRTYTCRVSRGGTIALPAVGELEVSGQTLADIEEKVVEAYRRYVVVRPSVYVRLLQYKTYRTSVIGAVAKPGVYMLRGDQMSLVSLLMEAGGIVEDGATVIRISRQKDGNTPSAPAGRNSFMGGASAGQGGRLALLPTEVTRPGTAPEMGTVVKAAFRQEGPLYTTGSLVLEMGDEILARKWLDIGNAAQRQRYLDSAVARLSPGRLDALQTKLSLLAEYLESSSGGPATLIAAGWYLQQDNQFVASLAGRPSGERPGRMGPGKLLSETSAMADEDTVTTLVLPVRGLNIPFRDVALMEGDTVIVERAQEPLFSVLGLVAHAGNFAYPPNVQYNVAQAIAFAGGLDSVADPRYVTIYRLAPDGSVVHLPLKLIENDGFTEALNAKVKPGDVVAVEHTPRTRANTVIHDLLRINTGLYISGNDLWNRD
jgi:protein involved in polysaccharide export with SLBB domain